jgi:hypothetical protein
MKYVVFLCEHYTDADLGTEVFDNYIDALDYALQYEYEAEAHIARELTDNE